MDEAATKTLVFYVNGKKVIDSNPDPGETLLTYLRNKLRSTSTSFSFSLIINSIKEINRNHTLLTAHMHVIFSNFSWFACDFNGVEFVYRRGYSKRLILIKLGKTRLRASNKYFRKCWRNKILLQINPGDFLCLHFNSIFIKCNLLEFWIYILHIISLIT